MTGEQNLGGAPIASASPTTEEYRVLLPIDVDGRVYEYGQVVSLDMATAKLYAHALVRVETAGVK